MRRTSKVPVVAQKRRSSGAAAKGVATKKVGRTASTGQFTGLPTNLQAAAVRVTSSRAESMEFLKKGGFLTAEGKLASAYTSKKQLAPTYTAKKK